MFNVLVILVPGSVMEALPIDILSHDAWQHWPITSIMSSTNQSRYGLMNTRPFRQPLQARQRLLLAQQVNLCLQTWTFLHSVYLCVYVYLHISKGGLVRKLPSYRRLSISLAMAIIAIRKKVSW